MSGISGVLGSGWKLLSSAADGIFDGINQCIQNPKKTMLVAGLFFANKVSGNYLTTLEGGTKMVAAAAAGFTDHFNFHKQWLINACENSFAPQNYQRHYQDDYMKRQFFVFATNRIISSPKTAPILYSQKQEDLRFSYHRGNVILNPTCLEYVKEYATSFDETQRFNPNEFGGNLRLFSPEIYDLNTTQCITNVIDTIRRVVRTKFAPECQFSQFHPECIYSIAKKTKELEEFDQVLKEINKFGDQQLIDETLKEILLGPMFSLGSHDLSLIDFQTKATWVAAELGMLLLTGANGVPFISNPWAFSPFRDSVYPSYWQNKNLMHISNAFTNLTSKGIKGENMLEDLEHFREFVISLDQAAANIFSKKATTNPSEGTSFDKRAFNKLVMQFVLSSDLSPLFTSNVYALKNRGIDFMTGDEREKCIAFVEENLPTLLELKSNLLKELGKKIHMLVPNFFSDKSAECIEELAMQINFLGQFEMPKACDQSSNNPECIEKMQAVNQKVDKISSIVIERREENIDTSRLSLGHRLLNVFLSDQIDGKVIIDQKKKEQDDQQAMTFLFVVGFFCICCCCATQ